MRRNVFLFWSRVHCLYSMYVCLYGIQPCWSIISVHINTFLKGHYINRRHRHMIIFQLILYIHLRIDFSLKGSRTIDNDILRTYKLESIWFDSGEGKCMTIAHYKQRAGSSTMYNRSILAFPHPTLSCPRLLSLLLPWAIVLSWASTWLYIHFAR